MNVLHLSTQDIGGGAADAAFRLHKNMRSMGINSYMLVSKKTSSNPYVFEAIRNKVHTPILLSLFLKIRRKLMIKVFGLSSYFYYEKNIFDIERSLDSLPITPEITMAHWISDFISVDQLVKIKKLTSSHLYWYLLDMGPFTGGCHYAFSCYGYLNDCGNCPQLGFLKSDSDASRKQIINKRDVLAHEDFTVVAASSWLKTQSKKSSLFGNRKHEQILLGLNHKTFKQGPKNQARLNLNLPLNVKIIYFGAQDLFEERKGYKYFIASLRELELLFLSRNYLKSDVVVVTAGHLLNGNINNIELPFKHVHLGFLSETDLVFAYQAADIFLCTSIEDSGPMMINESIICGTPVVAFDMGVASDLIFNGKTGYIAKLKDSYDMAIGLFNLLQMTEKESEVMRRNCHNTGLKYCSSRVQVEAFIRLFGLI